MNLWTGVLDLLFPPKCVFCGQLLPDGEREVCSACRRELPWLSGPAAEQTPEWVDLAVSPLRYEGKVRESFHRYKFGGQTSYAGAYAALMAPCVEEHLAGRFEVITWAPLSARRRRERGYDQAELLARALSRRLGVPAQALLVKTRHTAAQSGLEEAAARRANARDAYRCPHPERAAGRRLLLVDDVITSGATSSECARILRQNGAKAVFCATLARAR